MNIERFGNPSGKTVMLLPGTCCTWQINFQQLVPALEEYQVLCVDYDGFDGGGTVFTSMIRQTERLEQYIQEEWDGHIDLVYGSSLGGSFVGLLVQRGRVHIGHAVIGSSDLDQSMRLPAWLKAKFVAGFLRRLCRKPEEHQGLVRMLQDKMGMDLGEEGDSLLTEYFKKLAGVDQRSIFNQFYSDLVTPLGKQIEAPGTVVHVFYAEKMGEKYLKRYRAHFKDPDIRLFHMGHEGWLFDAGLMRRELARCISMDP